MDDEGDDGSQELGSAASCIEEADDDSEEADDDAFASSSEESDAAEEVAAARVERSTGRAISQIAVLEARATAIPTREGDVNAQGRSRRKRAPVNYSVEVQSQRFTSRS